MTGKNRAIGVDLGGTKTAVALVDNHGRVLRRLHYPTDVDGGPPAIIGRIADAVEELRRDADSTSLGIGVGVAGQIERGTGLVKFGPNLGWRNVPLAAELSSASGLQVRVTNDVRAAALGEWLFGAGRGGTDLVCVFVGTGIGGGIIADGRLLEGCSNTAGEVGHMTVQIDGPLCTCGKKGCLEALAGGWAIAERARQAVRENPKVGAMLLEAVEGVPENITAKTVSHAFRAGDPLSERLIGDAAEALVAGVVSLVNAFNPCMVILGGGVIEGIPRLFERVRVEVPRTALRAASESLKIVRSELGGEAGVTGAAAHAMKSSQGS